MIAKPGMKAFLDGKLALTKVGAAEKTTNETLARKLLGDTAADRFMPYAAAALTIGCWPAWWRSESTAL